MAWTNPTAYPTGTLITALIYENEIQQNLLYLYNEERLNLYDYEGTITTVDDSVVETTVWSFTLEGGDMGANDALRLWMYGGWAQIDGALDLTFRLKLGATTLWEISNIGFAGAATGWFDADLTFKNNNAVNAQKVWGTLNYGNVTSTALTAAHDTGTGAENTAADLTVAVTIQGDAAGVGNTFTFDYGYCRIMH